MWVPTQEEAILMFARFLKARHGTAAGNFARKTAKTLQDEGDPEGHKIWKTRATLRVIKSGTLSQMSRTALSPRGSTGAKLHKPGNVKRRHQ